MGEFYSMWIITQLQNFKTKQILHSINIHWGTLINEITILLSIN